MDIPETDLRKQIADLARAMKVGFFAILLGASFFNIRIALWVSPFFARIFMDMLGGKPLPDCTRFFISFHTFFLILSIALPFGGAAALFVKSVSRSVTITAVLLIVAVVQGYLTWQAMLAPLTMILQTMSGGSDLAP